MVECILQVVTIDEQYALSVCHPLTGIDVTNASRTMLMSLKDLAWDKQTLECE